MKLVSSTLRPANRIAVIRNAGSAESLLRAEKLRDRKHIPLVVVLAVGFDASLLQSRHSTWKSGGYLLAEANSIQTAILRIHEGNFDLVLLGNRLTVEDQERLSFLIRSSGCGVPVICVTKSSGQSHPFAIATIANDPDTVLSGIGEALAQIAKKPP